MVRLILFPVCAVLLACAADNTQEIMPTEAVPVPPSVPTFISLDDCGLSLGECAEGEFWRVFQRDFDDRLAVHEWLGTLLEERLDQLDQIVVPKLIFRRAQLGMALILENGRLEVLPSVIPDLERALAYNPSDPFFQIWLDTMQIATSQLNGDANELEAVLNRAWSHLDDATAETTRSTLVASLTGTTIGLALSTNAPQRTIEVLDTFACNPKVLEANPDEICGRGVHRRPCIDWCLQPSAISPFTGPGLLFHQAEAYARIGLVDEARDLLIRALQAPTADVWPFRYVVVDALSDVEAFSADINPMDPEQAVFLDVYANSQQACIFCHASPDAAF